MSTPRSFLQGQIDENVVLVYIGADNNTKSGVIYGDFSSRPVCESTLASGVLLFEIPTPLWIGWWDRKVRVGQGNMPGYLTFLTCDLPWSSSQYVSSIGFANNHPQYGGHFLTRNNIGIMTSSVSFFKLFLN